MLRYRNASGEKKFCGAGGLKQTELYTPEFGRAIAMWWAASSLRESGTDGLVGVEMDMRRVCCFDSCGSDVSLV